MAMNSADCSIQLFGKNSPGAGKVPETQFVFIVCVSDTTAEHFQG